MTEKFKTLFFVRSSLITLYFALTIPIPFISSENLKIPSIITFTFGLFLIFNITNDYVYTCDKKISYQTSFISKIFGKENWEIFWKDIKLIKSLPTSQGSKVHYFITNKNESFLVPQRIENLERFVSIVENKTKLNIEKISFISPLWTYKLLTYMSVLMIAGEIIAFVI
ncbi:conserved hypothetical protein [Prochlorococcus marinus str. MIT 9515]|uniref:Uncharacterized protein n=1 Tax=Prochlorococcus marinus (strain MIT 9515) TaxID=167542 RepID=A2BXA1_PROM5|nr:hypothetical protein [Prochlorococcus marinus]ABM72412.1 conserved hypothetical protein [Prochlorococcus marinus str. MIT 9515]